ncbi:MAG: TonB-dependent receptor plug domain-containing protein, partial [Sneathiella sp.]|nr:TonB-dependent receptor plug domain-containing protein [Sneathiella sp.]
SAASIAATVGGVYSKDDGTTDLNVRGSRSSGTDVYIDGIKVRGSQNLPKSSIEQVSVITGGIPAQFGDVTGGVINITTKGASKEWFGGIEYVTSGFKNGDDVIGLDKFGFNLLGDGLRDVLDPRRQKS